MDVKRNIQEPRENILIYSKTFFFFFFTRIFIDLKFVFILISRRIKIHSIFNFLKIKTYLLTSLVFQL